MIFKKIAILLILLFSILFVLEKTYTFALNQNKNIKTSYVLSNNTNADLLILGPCEPFWMINPDQLDKITNIESYNLSLSHSNFADNLLHLHLYLKNNTKPKYILLYITPESMDERYNTFNTYRFAHHLSDTLINKTVKEFDASYYKYSQIPFMPYAYYSNLINFNALQGLKHYFTNKKEPKRKNGYQPPIVQDWHYRLQNFVDLYPDQVNFNWSERREKYLKEIISLAKEKNIQLMLYESPVFEMAKPHQVNRYETLDRIQEIADQNNVPFYIFDDMEMAKDQSNFFSTLNTTVKGSVIFTDTLGHHLKNILQQSKN